MKVPGPYAPMFWTLGDATVTRVIDWGPRRKPLASKNRPLLIVPVPESAWSVVTSKINVPEAIKFPAVGSVKVKSTVSMLSAIADALTKNPVMPTIRKRMGRTLMNIPFPRRVRIIVVLCPSPFLR
jgi:hypothetical protein